MKNSIKKSKPVIKTGISNSWKSTTLGECLVVKHGKSQKGVEVPNGKYPILGSGGIIGRTNTTLYSKPSVLIGRKGTIDKPCYTESPFWTIDTLFYTQIRNGFLPKYLYYQFQVINWKLYNEGSGLPSLSASTVAAIKVKIPPLPEQHRIVAVLETWEKAIEKLARKISLKKQIKKGLMQRLLSGKIRLPGFKEAWQTIKLADLGKLVSGGTPSKKEDKYWSGSIPWISSSDIVEGDVRKVDIHRYISSEAVKNSTTSVIPAGSVVIVSRVGVGKVFVNQIPLSTSQDFQSLVIAKDKSDAYFIAFLLVLELQRLLMSNQGTSIRGFLKKDLEALILRIPSYKEQRAIAAVLTAADNEISQLERKLALLRDQKKYLLNNLITGAIRTPHNMNIHA